MQFSKLELVLSLLPTAFAQYGPVGGGSASSTTAAAAASSTPSAAPGVHVVTVGDGALAFNPSNVTAAVGETVQFEFFSTVAPTHSVAQSSFDSPCTPLNGTGIFSGPITTSGGENTNVFTVTINDTNPIWFYCSFPAHCGLGMGGVINPPTDGSQTIAQYIAAAKGVTSVEPTTVQGGVVGPAKAATSSSSSASASSSAGSGAEKTVGVQWAVFALTGILAVGMGSLMI